MKKKSSGIVGYAVSILLGAVIMFGLLFATVAAIQEDNRNYNYSNVGEWVVEKGDTLWEVAHFYSDNRHDVRQVVYEIEQLSDCDANLQPGQVLTVPLYDVIWGEDGLEKIN